ncbi:hypothetical protein ACJRO0_13320 [Acetobacter oryzifermentans]|uniref:hypothetical protein n=1 Tax=Acetobacter oryzifermentans TaxID=1633874 RepID=UPI0039BFFADE
MRAREEQVADLENQFGEEGTFTFVDDRDAATKHILEAEQRGYERARAECAADTRRLEWLEKLPFADIGRLPNGWEIRINNVRHWDMQPTLRKAIDAAMEGGK